MVFWFYGRGESRSSLLVLSGLFTTLATLATLLMAPPLTGAATHTRAIITHGLEEVCGLILGGEGRTERMAGRIAHYLARGRIGAGRRNSAGGPRYLTVLEGSHTTGLRRERSGDGLRRAVTDGERGVDLAELVVAEIEAIAAGLFLLSLLPLLPLLSSLSS